MNNATTNRDVAAIDLGSNSFHMVVAKVIDQDLQLVSKHKQRVHLASGLDRQRNLDNASIERGLACLTIFAERLQGFEAENVRIAATHTLREANNAHIFLQRAREVLPYKIEIIPGVEEARLIYLGVAHTQPQSDSKLVIDIGGGSTEVIIGKGFEPILINSKQMGCVSYTQSFFPNGELSIKHFTAACLAAEQKLESFASTYRKKGWDIAFGSSGSIKAIREVLIAMGHDDGVINPERLDTLIIALQQWKCIDDIELEGLSEDRKPVFVAGLAILTAVMHSLKINEVHFSEGALREGLLYEMEDSLKHIDIRMRTTESLASKHLVDLNHATHVRNTAMSLFNQVHRSLGIKKNSELSDLLQWGALLHEVGLSISLQAFHRHSAYILRHTYMPGFNQEQQRLLAMLVRFQRKTLKLNALEEFSLFKRKHIISLIQILRLSILLHGQRNDTPLSDITLSIETDIWVLSSKNSQWLKENKLLQADLVSEQRYWEDAEWVLTFQDNVI